jgi:hypothetical protein
MAQHTPPTQAWFSQAAANAYGSWGMTLASTGKSVRVTALYSTLDSASYNWPDKVYVGEIVAWSHHDHWDGKFDLINARRLGSVHPIVDIDGSAPVTKKAPRVKLNIGDTCSVCGKEWKQRELATSTYIGCWCAEET